MTTVTVAGAHGQTVALDYDSNSSAILARKLAAAITAGVETGAILPAVDTDGPPPPLPPNKIGEFVTEIGGMTSLPSGYKAVVNIAPNEVIFGSGDADESVLSSIGKFSFFATGGSGTVAAGGGTNRIVIPSTVTGAWSINTGNGDDTVLAGAGNDTINAGRGHNAIALGAGNNVVVSTGDDTVTASNGDDTITALGRHKTLVFGNSSHLVFVASDDAATVFGGSGSDTFFGSQGPDLVYGGTAGNNLLFAGTGTATLFAGGDGDQLFAAGNKAQALYAAGGNETLSGANASGADTYYGSSGQLLVVGGDGKDTFVAGAGSATIDGSIDMFVFTNGQAGGTALIQAFRSGQDLIDLQGYGDREVAKALRSQQVAGNQDTITLSDNTRITFAGISSLNADDFITSAGGSSPNDHGKFGHS
jgi:Ca2+-binding RTX toxin-like protein